MRKKTALFAAALVAVAAIGFTQTAFAVPTQQCTGEIDGPQTINANLVVPSGVTCNLQGPGLVINGNVSVQPGGRLIIGGATQVNGNVTSTGAGTDSTTDTFAVPESFSVVICNSTITGSVSISSSASQVLVGGTSAGGGGCGGNNIGGDVNLTSNRGQVSVSENSGDDCNIRTCRIGGNVSLTSNKGPTFVVNNDIGGNLACTSNGSVTASGNTANQKLGQCA